MWDNELSVDFLKKGWEVSHYFIWLMFETTLLAQWLGSKANLIIILCVILNDQHNFLPLQRVKVSIIDKIVIHLYLVGIIKRPVL